MSNIILPDLHAPKAAWVDVYARLGLKLFPCRGKHPLFPSAHPPGDPLHGVCKGECGQVGHGLYDATNDPAILTEWWRQHLDANIGWALGAEYWALDVDPRAGGDNTLFDLERRYGTLGHILLSHTGSGGSHYPFRQPPEGVVNKAKIGDGLDVQGNGSYIILPPSIHPDTGHPYMWDLVDGLDSLLPERAPDWLEHLVMPSAQAQARQVVVPGAPIRDGERNNALARLAINMARGGLTEAAIRAAIGIENQRCVPPLDDAELDKIVQGKTTAYPAHPYMTSSAIRSVLQGPAANAPSPVNGTAPATGGNGATGGGVVWGTPRQLRVTALSTVRPERVQWLWKPYLPLGRPVALEGDPGVGKSSLVAKIAAHLTSGQAFPNVLCGQAPQPFSACNVCLLTAEDDPGDTILPRIAVNGGDPARGRSYGSGKTGRCFLTRRPRARA